MTATKPFKFKQFSIEQDHCAMKVGTDGILLGAWADVEDAKSILDIGAGTGLIGIMLAQRTTDAHIHAVEIDEETCGQAAENMANSPWADRLEAVHGSIQDFAKKTSEKYDLIVSNPPFFSGGTLTKSQDKDSVRHTVKLAHGDLLSVVRSLLAPQGRFCAILPNMEGLRFKELATTYHLHCTRMVSVLPQADKPVERLLLQFEREPSPVQKSELVLLNSGQANDWTPAFAELASEFYLEM